MKNLGFLALLLKLTPLGLKLFKILKSLKFALAIGSMVAYSYLFTWEFAVILLISIVFHEYGHTTAMKKCGLKVKGIYLIPFLGGVSVPENSFKNRRDETFIALYGPYYGLLLLIPFLIYGIVFESNLAIGLASFMALINLFNLLPINPLDGGRVIKSLAFSINNKLGLIILAGGIVLSAFLVWIFGFWILLFVMIIGALELLFEYKEYKNSKRLEYDQSINENNNFDMNKENIKLYTYNYLILSSIFIFVIYLTGQYEGADLALKMIMDDLDSGF